MSNKATCPACGSHTSSIWMAIEEGTECPNCGLSAEAMLQFEAARRRGADEELVENAAKAEQRAEAAEQEVRQLRRALREIRSLTDAGYGRSSSGEQPPPSPLGSAERGGGTIEGGG